ncbi:MAG TPA: flavin reductase family protein [Brevundimonas sp.]|jgi:3-hydroxy-9,10-secoandrosta-1,3,5(10)-triene-9,17-dione monooxygenase reductase component|uniref:flavin reductase family protein n=1 Tax=Brevundimonas sp. TaxID=1871086 RepID=UPI002DE6CECA|nr:flavin reductase family protein [Brevundimonas sp.]
MSLEPVPEDLADASLAYRRALGAFPTGVCVMTVDGPDGPVGITANSFASVSLEPRLILWSIALSSERMPAFAAGERFAVHVLTADDAERADRFARGDCRLTPDDAELRPGVAPRLAGVLARLDCCVHARSEIGDHLVLVGRVEAFEASAGEALTYFRGRYGRASSEISA